MNYSTMTIVELLAAAESHLETERDLESVLLRAADLASDAHPELELLFRVLAAEPSEIAATRAEAMVDLARRLHPDSDGPMLCRIVGCALAQFADD